MIEPVKAAPGAQRQQVGLAIAAGQHGNLFDGIIDRIADLGHAGERIGEHIRAVRVFADHLQDECFNGMHAAASVVGPGLPVDWGTGN